MAAPKNRFGYNEFAPRRGKETYERQKVWHVSAATQIALDELEIVASWAEFVEICERQKQKKRR